MLEARFSKCPEILFLSIEKGYLGHLLKKGNIPVTQECRESHKYTSEFCATAAEHIHVDTVGGQIQQVY